MEKMKPILFSTPMVQAILDGRKTQTRRICKDVTNCDFKWGLDREPYIGDYKTFAKIEKGKWGWVTLENQWLYDLQTAVDDSRTYLLKPPYQKGDILWVRETWADLRGMGFGNDPRTDKPWNYAYLADSPKGSEGYRISQDYGIKWHPSIHMPREAARLFLKVTDVKVERLQDITEEDARAEGFEGFPCPNVGAYACTDCMGTGWLEPPWVDFMFMWDKLNAKRGYSWETNPWVWAITFERLEVI